VSTVYALDPIAWTTVRPSGQCTIDGRASDAPRTRTDVYTEPDELLMRRYQRGEESAFRRLYERHRAGLLRFVGQLAPGASDRDEIAQETWMAVIRQRDRYRPSARFVTYLYSIAHRRTVDRWRRIGRWPEADADAEGADLSPAPVSDEPESHLQRHELRRALLAALERLPLVQREAFLLRAEGGLSIAEIAEATGTNAETAKSRLRFAHQRLRIALEGWR